MFNYFFFCLQVSVWKEPNCLKNIGYEPLRKVPLRRSADGRAGSQRWSAEIAAINFSSAAPQLCLSWVKWQTRWITSKDRWSCWCHCRVSRLRSSSLRPWFAIAHCFLFLRRVIFYYVKSLYWICCSITSVAECSGFLAETCGIRALNQGSKPHLLH